MCSENVYICVNVKNQAQLKLESIDFLKKIPNFLTFKKQISKESFTFEYRTLKRLDIFLPRGWFIELYL